MSFESDSRSMEIHLIEEKLGAMVWAMVNRLARIGTVVNKIEVYDVVRAAIQAADVNYGHAAAN